MYSNFLHTTGSVIIVGTWRPELKIAFSAENAEVRPALSLPMGHKQGFNANNDIVNGGPSGVNDASNDANEFRVKTVRHGETSSDDPPGVTSAAPAWFAASGEVTRSVMVANGTR
jgi:hypothetical protein